MTYIEFEKELDELGVEGAFDISVPVGWYQLVIALINDLIRAGWDKKLDQAKSKFGGLRFYIRNYDVGLAELINQYEFRSFKICEFCGAQAQQTRTGGWISTVCELHLKELNAKNQ